MAGAIFGEVGVSLFVARVVFGETLGDSPGAKCCALHAKCVAKMGQISSANGPVRDHESSWSDRGRILLESCFSCQKQIMDFSIKSRTYNFMAGGAFGDS